MISGIGTDIVEISRMKKILREKSEGFVSRIFTDAEIRESRRKKNKAEFFAGRWAVKEAVSKALGCGIGDYCAWKDVNTSNAENGAPQVVISGNAKKYAKKMKISKIHVSISHEKNYACASVVLEKL